MSTNTKFWVSRIIVMVVVIVIAAVFLLHTPAPSSTLKTKAFGTSKKNQSIADSVSSFYSEFKQSSTDPIKERFGEDTIMLDDNNNLPLGASIEQVSEKTYRPIENWNGKVKQRAFAAQSTLMQEAKIHARKEGFNLVWDLKQDFVVRQRYHSTTTLTGMLEDIAGAVGSNFTKPIRVYFCSEKRTLVITERESEYLQTKCQKSNESF